VLRGASRILEQPQAPLILYACGKLTAGFGYHAVESVWFLEPFGYHFFVLDSASGLIRKFKGARDFDCILIAVKPQHALYSVVEGLAT